MKPKDSGFLHYFDTRDIFQDIFITKITGKYSLDIIKLDNWMIENKGYNIEKHGSLKDFILSEFGKKAHNFIVELLE